MSIVTDLPNTPGTATSGARAFARLNTDQTVQRMAPAREELRPAEPEATVTIDKIGDFLELDFRRLFTWLGKGMVLIIVLAVTGVLVGGAYAVLSKPRFTVGTDILIDPANLQIVADDLYAAPGQVDGQLLSAGSKLRVLTSRNVLARVVADLGLVNDTEFYDPRPSFSLSSILGGGSTGTPTSPEVAALAALAQRVTTTADEKSFVATLLVTAESTDKAIRISEAMVGAFRAELADAEADGASRAAAAIDDRLAELKAGVQAAEEKVEAYKRSNNLSASGGQLVSNQTLTQLNAQVVDAQSRVIAAQAAYDTLVAVGADASGSGSTASASLTALRDKAAALQQDLDAQSMVYGPRHPTIVGLQAQVAAAKGQMQAELDRVVNGARAALDEAKAGLEALQGRAANLEGEVFSDNASQVALRELERDASSKTAIYESFLSRARQITEREQIDTTNVRVISTAVPPPARSWPPRTVVVMALGGFAGLALGVMLALALGIARDMRGSRSKRGDTGLAA